MNATPRTSLDLLIRLGAGAGLFSLWTVLETQIIEPSGLYVYLPLYRVNGICIWDVFAIALIVAAFALAGRPRVGAK